MEYAGEKVPGLVSWLVKCCCLKRSVAMNHNITIRFGKTIAVAALIGCVLLVPALSLGASDPDGSAYAGDLEADDLRAEDLGVSMINLSNVGCPWVRATYTKTSGTGTWNARLHEKKI